MASRRRREIEAALLRKGFRESKKSHHRYLTLYVNGEERRVRTYLSHGGRDHGDALLSQMQKQLRLPSKQDLLNLIDCPMDADEYVALLAEQGDLNN